MIALDILEDVLLKGAYSNIRLDQILRQHALNPQDRGFVTNIVYGVLQHKIGLEYQLAPYIGKNKKMEDWVALLLVMSVYQMQYMDRVPTRAVIFESVQIAKKRGHAGIGKLVNAVLRNIQRKGFLNPEEIGDTDQRFSVLYSMPLAIVSLLIQQLGVAKAQSIFESINQPPKTSLRVNTALTTVGDVREALNVDYHVSASAISPVGLVADGGHLAGDPLFQNGEIVLQDESAQLVAPALKVQPNDYVLDACAAPGGKTTHIATYLGPKGHVEALDTYPKKIDLLLQNAKRQHLEDAITGQVLDARQVQNQFKPYAFDKILVDAPCSGIGLMRRKPEVRYRKEMLDFKRLQHLQLQILDAVAPTLMIGGRLVYSTCTIVAEENQEVVAAFLESHPNFSLEPTYVDKQGLAPEKDYLTIYPDDYLSDGFFIASIRRNS